MALAGFPPRQVRLGVQFRGKPVMLTDFTITAFATLFVAIGPIDTAIVFGGLTAGVHRPERFRLAWQAVLIAGIVLLGFALFGNRVLAALRVSLDAFRSPRASSTEPACPTISWIGMHIRRRAASSDSWPADGSRVQQSRSADKCSSRLRCANSTGL
jgi:MarC family integral membrane protein